MMWWIIGITINGSGTLIGSLGRIMLRLSHVVSNKGDTVDSQKFFWLGVILLIINPAMDTASYWFASPTLLAPMAGLTLLWNLLLAPTILREELSVWTVGGSCLTGIGCVLVALFGPKNDISFNSHEEITDLFTAKDFIIYSICVSTFLLALSYIMVNGFSSEFVQKISYPIVGGWLGGLFIFLKCAVELVRIGAWDTALTYLMGTLAIVTPLSGVIILNAALKDYEALFILPIYHAFLILAGATSSVIFFQDLADLSTTRVVIYTIAIGLIFSGVLFVSLHGYNLEEGQEQTGLLATHINLDELEHYSDIKIVDSTQVRPLAR